MEANRRRFLTAAAGAAGAAASLGSAKSQSLPDNIILAQSPPTPVTQASATAPAAAAEAVYGTMNGLPSVTISTYAAPSTTQKIFVRNLRVLQDQAQKVIPTGGFGYISSAAGDEWTYHENMDAFKRRQIVPRYLTGNPPVDTTTTLLGHKLALPIITTVFGGHAIAHVNAEAATAKATHEMGTIFTCGSQAGLPMEVVAQASPGTNFMQLYMQNDQGLMREFLQRAKASGYQAIVLTIDAFFPSNRETDMANHYESPFPAANFPKRQISGYTASTNMMKRNLGWDDVAFIQKESGLPVIVKGVMAPSVAVEAIRAGCAAIQVSNHGGRQLDDQPATFTMLPRIADAVGGRIPIIFDSGVRRGQDVFKALALGANVIALGRPILYGLSLGGWMGVQSVYEKISAEFTMTMMAAGTQSIKDINRDCLLT